MGRWEAVWQGLRPPNEFLRGLPHLGGERRKGSGKAEGPSGRLVAEGSFGAEETPGRLNDQGAGGRGGFGRSIPLRL